MSRLHLEGGIDLSKAAILTRRVGRLAVAEGVLPTTGNPSINQELAAFGADFGKFSTRPGKGRIVVPEWLAEQPKPIPLLLVNDFGEDRSTVECEQKIHAVFVKKGLTYEAPHTVQDIEHFNIRDGAYNVYQHVSTALSDEQPSVFVGVVDPGVGTERRGIIVSTEEGYTFVGPDNGLFWPAIHHHGLHIKEAYQIDPDKFSESSATFHGRDQFSPIGARIATGEEPWEIDGLIKLDPETLVKYKFKNGQVIEKDGYPNIKLWPEGLPLNDKEARPTHIKITNPKRFDQKWEEGVKDLGIELGIEHTESGDSIIIPVVPTFESVKVGEPLCYMGSSGREGLPEIAIRNGSEKNGAGNRLNVDIGDLLEVEWVYGNPIEQELQEGVLATE